MNIALCIGCLATLTALAEATGLPEQQVGLEGRSQGYNITRNELGTDDEDSMKARKGKGYCVPSPYCFKHGYCVKKRKHCNGIVKASECCGSKKCFCCIPECTPPFHKIHGCGSCYLFSQDVGADPVDWNDANQYCKQKGEEVGVRSELASAGYLPATDADPLLKYVNDNGLGRIWVGAYKSESLWKWLDGRTLSVDSNLWANAMLNPSGDGDCVEIIPYDPRAVLNDRDCYAVYGFVCESK